MRDIKFYLEKAKEVQGINSNNKLAILLNITGAGVSEWHRLRGLPSPDKMVELAKLADIPPEIALSDLNIWDMERHSPNGPAMSIYQKLTKMTEKATGFTAGGALLP